jgi:catechol 2,3-dioxygenase-like lactoylglutathione lyase family enzyme
MVPARVGYLILFVAEMERSVAFYRDVLGLPLQAHSPYWTEFALEGCVLALHHGGVPCQRPEGGERAGSVQLCFPVDDVEATFAAVTARGVPVKTMPTLLPEENIQLAVVLDPDGVEISFFRRLEPAAGG